MKLVPLLFATVLLSWGGIHAAEVEFRPELELRILSDGNVAVVGQETVSDEVAQVAVNLSLTARSRASLFTMRYRPYRETHNDFSQLDYTGHDFLADLEHNFSKRATFSMSADFTRTERQGLDLNRPDQAVTLTPRTTIDRLRAGLGGEISSGRRMAWLWDVAGSSNDYEDADGSTYEDSDTLEAGVGWAYTLSERSAAGISYRYRDLSFETFADTDVHNIEATYGKQLTRAASINLRGGVTRADDGVDETTEPSFALSVNKETGDDSLLVLGVRQDISSGNGLGGASKDLGAYLSWSKNLTARISATFGISHWSRENLELGDIATAGIDTTVTSESVYWEPVRQFSLGIFHSYTDQGVSDVADPGLDTDYHRAGVVLRWSPLEL